MHKGVEGESGIPGKAISEAQLRGKLGQDHELESTEPLHRGQSARFMNAHFARPERLDGSPTATSKNRIGPGVTSAGAPPREKSLGAVIRSRRQVLGLSQRELARQLNVKPAHVAYLELDQRRPSLPLLGRIADLLNLERQPLFLLSHPEAGFLVAAPAATKPANQVWKDFCNNKALLMRHRIRPRELRILSQVNLLGKVAAPRQYLFILNSIRQALEDEDV